MPAKKTTALTFEERRKKLNAAIDKINSSAGRVICGTIDQPEIRAKLELKFIPTPNDDLNAAIGGGFPIGRTSVVTGLSDSGKTSLLLETIGQQMQRDKEFIALWLESEQSLNLDYMEEQFGIDPERFYCVQFTSDEGAEAALDRCEAILRIGSVNMFVINSLRALVPRLEMNKPVSEDTMAVQARMNTKMLKKFLNIIYENDICFVIVQHLSTSIGVMSRDPYALSGGLFLKYGGLLILDMRKQSVLDNDPIDASEGMKIKISVKKNHIVPTIYPYVKVMHYVIYGEGTEVILSTLNKAVEQGVIRTNGAWIFWDAKNLRWQGKQNFRNAMREDKILLQELRNATNASVQKLTESEMEKLGIDLGENSEEQAALAKNEAELEAIFKEPDAE